MIDSDTANFVLVHGAYHGGWCWRRVRSILHREGHQVFTPSQTGCGDRVHLLHAGITIETFIDDITSLIAAEELDNVILVGHSFGARTILGVADIIPEMLAHLVFLDGGLPTPGMSRLDTLSPEVRAARVAAAESSSEGMSIPAPDPGIFGVTDPADGEWLRRRLTAQPFGVDTSIQTFAHGLGNSLPATYVHHTDPIFAGTESAAQYARSRPDWRYTTLPGGHDAMVTNPRAVAKLLSSIARGHRRSETSSALLPIPL